MQYKLLNKNSIPLDSDEFILIVKHIPNWLERLFGARSKEVEYRGSGTLWWKPSGKCNSFLDGILYDLCYSPFGDK